MAAPYIVLVMQGMTGVDPNAKLVACALAEQVRRGSEGICWPGVGTIARLANMSPRQATDRLASLQADGWLTAVKYPKGGRTPTHYRLNWERLRESADATKATQDAARSATQDAARLNRGIHGGNHAIPDAKPRNVEGKPRRESGETAQHVADEPLNLSTSTGVEPARAHATAPPPVHEDQHRLKERKGEPETIRTRDGDLTAEEQARLKRESAEKLAAYERQLAANSTKAAA